MTSFKVLNHFIKGHMSCHNFCLTITKIDNDFQVVFHSKYAKGQVYAGCYRNFHMSLFHHHAYGWSEFEDVDRPT
jgi:hypothetical protein